MAVVSAGGQKTGRLWRRGGLPAEILQELRHKPSVIGVDVALFGHDEGADEVGPKAEGAAEKGDDPAYPHQGGVDVKILRDAAAHPGEHFVGALCPV